MKNELIECSVTCIFKFLDRNCMSSALKSISDMTDIFSKTCLVFHCYNEERTAMRLVLFDKTFQWLLIFFPAESNGRFTLSRTQ
jgi:hypothetical protein